jgi:hypothetical protein
LLGMPVKCSTKRFHFLFIQRHHQHAWQTTKWGKTLVIHNLRSHIQNIKGVYESIKQWSAWLNKITGGYNSSIWKGTECKASLGYPMRPCLHKKKERKNYRKPLFQTRLPDKIENQKGVSYAKIQTN